jgi:sugar/nucleoside kinase (ribokinase family)
MAITELDPHRVVDAFFAGTVFLDVILSGLPSAPVPGQEIWATGQALSPGGIANNAAGTARLGLRTGLAAVFGDDECGDLVWRMLAAEPRLDLSWSRRVPRLDTALTVSLSPVTAADRALVSHGVLNPVPLDDLTETVPRAGATFVSLSTGAGLPAWISLQRAAGAVVFADVGWDERYGWSRDVLSQLGGVDVFVPNEAEAMAYTGASTPRAALRALGELVPQVFITCGAAGVLALDAGTGEEVAVPAIASGQATDTTGAGDEFVAGLIHATLAGQPLANRARYGCVCAGLAVRKPGGALGAPTLADIKTWLAGAPPEYGFIRELLTSTIDGRNLCDL